MQRRPIDVINILAMLFCFAVGIGMSWLAWPIEIKVDKDAGQYWPAWVQAIGGLLGIAAAVIAPLLIYSREFGERRAILHLRQRTFILVFLPLARELGGSVRSATVLLNSAVAPSIPDFNRAERLIEPADRLQNMVLQFHEAGESGAFLHAAIFSIPKVQEILITNHHYEAARGMVWDLGHEDMVPMRQPEDWRLALANLEVMINIAITEMEAALRSRKVHAAASKPQ